MKRSTPYSTPRSATRTRTSYASKSRGRNVSRKRKPSGSSVVKFNCYGFPTKLQVKHRYADNINFAAAAAGTATYSFRANGMYDPDYSGTGHQPLYFDQLAAVYDHFTVLKSWIKITVTNTTAYPAMFNAFLNDDVTVTPTSVLTRAEQSAANTRLITKEGGPVVFYLSFDAYKVFGGSVLGNDNLQGTSSADPTEQSIYTLSCTSTDGAQATACSALIEIVYTAVWDEIRDIASS